MAQGRRQCFKAGSRDQGRLSGAILGREIQILPAGHHGCARLHAPQGPGQIRLFIAAGQAGSPGYVTGQPDIEHGQQIVGIVAAVGG